LKQLASLSREGDCVQGDESPDARVTAIFRVMQLSRSIKLGDTGYTFLSQYPLSLANIQWLESG